MRERYVCDRNGGIKARYLRRRSWRCPRCGEWSEWNGHVCGECRHRVCCACFHHDLGLCLSNPGSDVRPTRTPIEPCLPKLPRRVRVMHVTDESEGRVLALSCGHRKRFPRGRVPATTTCPACG